MSYTAHLDLLTVPVWSPLHKREWKITPRQYRLMCRILSGRRFTLRVLAVELGYSRSGLADALQSLTSGGLVAVQTRLGRKGWTFAKAKPGVTMTGALNAIQTAVGNVRQLGRTSLEGSLKGSRSPIADISQTGPSGPSGEGCFAALMAAAGFKPAWSQ